MIRRPPRSTPFPTTTFFRSPHRLRIHDRPVARPAEVHEEVLRRLVQRVADDRDRDALQRRPRRRSEEHTSELQSRQYLVCRLLLEKKKKENILPHISTAPEY